MNHTPMWQDRAEAIPSSPSAYDARSCAYEQDDHWPHT